MKIDPPSAERMMESLREIFFKTDFSTQKITAERTFNIDGAALFFSHLPTFSTSHLLFFPLPP